MSYRSVKSILASGFDQLPPELTDGADAVLHLPATHAHVRGADYYRTSLTEPPCAPALTPDEVRSC